MKPLLVILAITWSGLWFYPDQLGQRLSQKGEYEKAAEAYRDPMRKGVAQFRAGNFKDATQNFARVDTPEGHYNLGNTWVMQGKYENAIESYDKALKMRPDWKEAQENKALAQARAKLLETEGGDMTGGKLPPDEIVFDAKKPDGQDGGEEQVTGNQKLSSSEVQALWLRRVQTRPADFLKAKFSYQLANPTEGDDE